MPLANPWLHCITSQTAEHSDYHLIDKFIQKLYWLPHSQALSVRAQLLCEPNKYHGYVADFEIPTVESHHLYLTVDPVCLPWENSFSHCMKFLPMYGTCVALLYMVPPLQMGWAGFLHKLPNVCMNSVFPKFRNRFFPLLSS